MKGRTDGKERTRRNGHLEAGGVTIVVVALSWFVACQGDAQRVGRVSTFVNESARLPADLAEAFVPFEFEYPADWSPVDGAPDAGMFVQLRGSALPGRPGSAETVSVFPFRVESGADLEEEARAWADAVRRIRGFSKAASRSIRVADRDLPSILLDGLRDDAGEEVWGRVVLVPVEGAADGVLLGVVVELVGSAGAGDFHGPEDLGLRGGGGLVLASLRMAGEERRSGHPKAR